MPFHRPGIFARIPRLTTRLRRQNKRQLVLDSFSLKRARELASGGCEPTGPIGRMVIPPDSRPPLASVGCG